MSPAEDKMKNRNLQIKKKIEERLSRLIPETTFRVKVYRDNWLNSTSVDIDIDNSKSDIAEYNGLIGVVKSGSIGSIIPLTDHGNQIAEIINNNFKFRDGSVCLRAGISR